MTEEANVLRNRRFRVIDEFLNFSRIPRNFTEPA